MTRTRWLAVLAIALTWAAAARWSHCVPRDLKGSVLHWLNHLVP